MGLIRFRSILGIVLYTLIGVHALTSPDATIVLYGWAAIIGGLVSIVFGCTILKELWQLGVYWAKGKRDWV